MRFWLRSGAIAIALLLAGPVFAFVGEATGSRSDDDWTALRFEQPNLAASGLTPGTPTTVTVAIDRHGAAASYEWTASIRMDGTATVIGSGDARLAADSTATFAVDVPASLATPGARLFVRLDAGQQIDLRVGS